MEKIKTHKRFLGVLAFWAIILIGGLTYLNWSSNAGKTIILAVEPIDPRDIFRGDYVILNYEISTIELSKEDEAKYEKGDSIYLLLKEDDEGIWRYETDSTEPMQNTDGNIEIKGEVKSVYSRSSEEKVEVRIDYGIEQFFVPEGKGKIIENIRWEESERITVETNVHKGKAYLKNILLDGERIDFNALQVE